MDRETHETLESMGRTIESLNEALRLSAEATEGRLETVRLFGLRLRALERRVDALVTAIARPIESPPPVALPRWSILVEICRHPYAMVVGAVLIGLMLAVLRVEGCP